MSVQTRSASLVYEKWKVVIPETAVAFWLCLHVYRSKSEDIPVLEVSWKVRGDDLWRWYLSQDRLFPTED